MSPANSNSLRDRYRKTTNALASAAHDLKTPLAILNGYIDLLRSQKLGPLNDRQREVMADMFSSGQRLQQFIQDFLTFSVLEIGELRMQYIDGDPERLPLGSLPPLVAAAFRSAASALYFLANDKLSPFAFDGPKIQRIVSNLLENASKYTPQGGTVWLHAEPHMWERRGVSSPGANGRPPPVKRRNIPNAVKVSVSDTGPGIRPEFHLEIFDDFFRLPRQRVGRRHGPRTRHLPPPPARHGRQDLGRKANRERVASFSFIIPLKTNF